MLSSVTVDGQHVHFQWLLPRSRPKSLPLADLKRVSGTWADILADASLDICQGASIPLPDVLEQCKSWMKPAHVAFLAWFVAARDADLPVFPHRVNGWLPRAEDIYHMLVFADYWRMDRLQAFMELHATPLKMPKELELVPHLQDQLTLLRASGNYQRFRHYFVALKPHYLDYGLLVLQLNPADNGQAILQECIEKGYVESVAHLLKDARIDPCADNHMALRRAVSLDETAIAALLLSDKRCREAIATVPSLLFCACTNNNVEMVQLLVQHGANPTVHDDRYATPIYCAILRDQPWIFKQLLASPHIDLTQLSTLTTLFYDMILSEAVECLNVLLHDPRIDPLRPIGTHVPLPPLHLAVLLDKGKSTKCLLTDARIVATADITNLIKIATENDSTELVQLLKDVADASGK